MSRHRVLRVICAAAPRAVLCLFILGPTRPASCAGESEWGAVLGEGQ